MVDVATSGARELDAGGTCVALAVVGALVVVVVVVVVDVDVAGGVEVLVVVALVGVVGALVVVVELVVVVATSGVEILALVVVVGAEVVLVVVEVVVVFAIAEPEVSLVLASGIACCCVDDEMAIRSATTSGVRGPLASAVDSSTTSELIGSTWSG